jgi:uncharacterized protein (TIGR00252 family)
VTTTSQGHLAEAAAAVYLERQGHTILDRNWRNRWCELDLVTRSRDGLHIVEVKYRHRPDWGTGFEAITPDKLARLARAASAWCQAHSYTESYQLDAVSVSGSLGQPVVEYVPNITF